MHILLNESLCNVYNAYAYDIIIAFVYHFGQLYGNDMMVYNVHGLVHLPNELLNMAVFTTCHRSHLKFFSES